MARISIIVPVYNVRQHLRKCLDSILAQTFRDWELICVDDGSTDGSADILAEYAARDGRVRTVRQANAGQAAARNRGMDEAGGEYVMFCDADDWVEPTWCEELYGAIAAREDVDLVVARAFIDGTCDAKQRQRLEENQRLKFEGVQPVSPEMFPRIDHAVWMKIFRRSLFTGSGLRFPVGEVCEDWSFSYGYLAICRKALFLDRKLYHYIQREGSTLNGGRRGEKVALDFVRQWDHFRRFLVAQGKWETWRLAMLSYGIALFGSGNDEVRPKIQALADEFLSAMPASDFENLPTGIREGLEWVRAHKAHLLQCRRWKIGPLTVVKVKQNLSCKKVYVLGVRVFKRRFQN